MSNYSYERDSKNNLTKKVVFHKFKMEKDGVDFHFTPPQITVGTSFNIDHRYNYHIKEMFNDHQNNIHIYQISMYSVNRDISVSSKTNDTEKLENVDEIHYWLSIHDNKLWCATTIKSYPTTKALEKIFDKVFNKKLTFQHLPNQDILDEIQKHGIRSYSVIDEVDISRLPSNSLIDKFKSLKDTLTTRIVITNSSNNNILSDIKIDDDVIDALDDESFFVLKNGTKINGGTIKKTQSVYFREFLTTHSVDFSSMKECLLDLWS